MKTYPSSFRRPSLNFGLHLQKTCWCAVSIAALLTANAQATYWDADGISSNLETMGSGIWDTTSALHYTNSTTPDGVWNNNGTTQNYFRGADDTHLATVTVGEDGLKVQDIIFQASGYTLTSPVARTLNVNALKITPLRSANTVTATIDSNLTLAPTADVNLTITQNAAGAGVLNFYGKGYSSSLSRKHVSISAATASNLTVNVEAGALLANSEARLDGRVLFEDGTTLSGTTVVNVNGGTIKSNEGVQLGTTNGVGGNQTLNLNSGLVSGTGATYGLGIGLTGAVNSTGTYTFNLKGGVAFVSKVVMGSGNSTFNFDGGTLKASAASAIFIDKNATFAAPVVNVLGGGAVIDTNGFAITSVLALRGTAGDGGLTVKGGGKLTLNGANTYVGATTIKSGTLTLAATGSIDTSSTIVVGDAGSTGTVLDVTAKTGGFAIGASQTLKGIGTIKGAATTINGTLAPGNSIGTITTGSLTLAATSVLDVELGRDGTVAISDNTNVVGDVRILSGADLRLTLYTGLTSPEIGDVFYLLSNDGSSDVITGEFTKLNGVDTTLSEGSKFDWNNFQWEITYKANSGTAFSGGNDMAIMAVAVVPEPSTWAMIVGGVGMLAFGNRIRRRMPR